MRYNWEISTASSLIEFSIKYYEIARIKGYFRRFNGEIIAGSNFDNPKIRISLEADSISTLNKECDNSLISPAFLSAKQYPLIAFESDHGCQLSEGGIQELTGDLLIRDTTKKVTLLVTLSEIKSVRKESNAQFSLITSFLLSDFGIEAGDAVFGDQVNLSMRLILNASLPT
jgi:polyisoprenoid-binding protein YceI